MMKSIATSLTVWRLRRVDQTGKGLDARSLITRDLIVRGGKERNLIDQGDTERSLTTISLGKASMTQR
jgi:hypothetical protein